MSDIAALGLSVESSGVRRATEDLRDFQQASGPAARGADQVSGAMEGVAASSSTAATAMGRAAAAMEYTSSGVPLRLQSAMQGAAESTNQLTGAMARGPSMAERLQRALHGAGGAAGAAGGGFSAAAIATQVLSGAFSALWKIATTVGSALVALFTAKAFLQNTIEAEEAQVQLATALKATGGASGQSIAMLNEHAAAMQKLTNNTDETVNSAQAVLMTFNRVRGDVFPKVIEAAADLSARFGTDLVSATRMVGRAMEDPIRGMLNLRRMGIMLDETDEKRIKTLLTLNKMSEAQAIVLEKIAMAAGGAARAQRDTLGGAMKAVKKNFGDAFELGAEAIDPLRQAVEGLNKAVSSDGFRLFVQTIGNALFWALGIATDALTYLVNKISDATNWMASFKDSVASVHVAVSALDSLFQGSALAHYADRFVQVTDKMFGLSLIMKGLSGINLGDMWTSTLQEINGIVGALTGVTRMLEYLANNLAPMIKDAFVTTFNAIRQILLDWANSATVSVGITERAFEMGLKSLLKAYLPVKELANNNAGAFSQAGSDLAAIFNNGFVNNIFSNTMMNMAIEKGRQAALRMYAEGQAMKAPGGYDVTLGMPSITSGAFALPPPPPDGVSDKGGKKDLAGSYAALTKAAEAFIAKQQAEQQALQLTGVAANALRYHNENLAKAANDNVKLTDAQVASLRTLATEMARAKNAAEATKFSQDFATKSEEFIGRQAMEKDALFMSAEAALRAKFAYDALADAKRRQIELTPEMIAAIQQGAAAQAAAQTSTDNYKKAISDGKEIFKGFFSDMREGLVNGQTIWESFGASAINVLNRIAEKLMEFALNKLWENAFPSGGGAGGGLGGILGSIFGSTSATAGSSAGGLFSGATGVMSDGFALSWAGAKGGVLDRGKVLPFAQGGIVNGPTTFPMAGGQTGLMGEAGPEGILPLRRGRDGSLGVQVHGQGGSAEGGDVAPVIHIHQTIQVGSVVSGAQHDADMRRVKKEAIDGANAAWLDMRGRSSVLRNRTKR